MATSQRDLAALRDQALGSKSSEPRVDLGGGLCTNDSPEQLLGYLMSPILGLDMASQGVACCGSE